MMDGITQRGRHFDELQLDGLSVGQLTQQTTAANLGFDNVEFPAATIAERTDFHHIVRVNALGTAWHEAAIARLRSANGRPTVMLTKTADRVISAAWRTSRRS